MKELRSTSSKVWAWVVPILILIGSVLIFYWLKSTKPQTPAEQPKARVWPVQVLDATSRSHQPEINLLGRVETPFEATITAALSVPVQGIHALSGEILPEKRSLISLDPVSLEILKVPIVSEIERLNSMLRAEKLQYQNNLSLLSYEQELLVLSQASVTRLQSLQLQGSTTQTRLEEAKQGLLRQQISVLSRQQLIDGYPHRKTQLRAQIDRANAELSQFEYNVQKTQGQFDYPVRVNRLLVAPEDRLSPGMPIATIYPKDQLEVRAQLPAHLVGLIRRQSGQTALMGKALINEQWRELVLHRLSSEVKTGQGGVDALFRFKSPPDGVAVGKSVTMTFYLPALQNTVALPGSAFFGQQRIFTVTKEDTLRSHQVERLGNVSEGYDTPRILVDVQRLPEDEPILISQLPNAITGLSVSVIENSGE